MAMYWFLGFACIFLHFLFTDASADSGYCFDASKYLVREIGLGVEKFWGSKTQNVEHCMKLCVRQKQCKSINFDLETGMCELNKKYRNGTQKVSKSNVYSEFRSWPPEVDKNCYNRPCKDNEVCIPKTLLMSSDDGTCSYSCMQFSRPVCPLPKMGTFNGRNVGAVNIVKCPNGMFGGGNATCQSNLRWDKEIDKCVGFRSRIWSNSSEKFLNAFLEINYDGEWKNVSSDNWNWKNTQVACRDLHGLEYGGFSRARHQSAFKTNKIAVKISCNGTEKTLGNCDFNGTEDSQELPMMLFCFKYNISDGKPLVYIQLSSESLSESDITSSLLWVKFHTAWRRVHKECSNDGHRWGQNETNVACRSVLRKESILSPDFQFGQEKDSLTFVCRGDEPHLLNCHNPMCQDSTWDNMEQVKLTCN